MPAVRSRQIRLDEAAAAAFRDWPWPFGAADMRDTAAGTSIVLLVESEHIGNFPGGSRVDYLGAAVNDDAQLIDETLAGNRAAFGQLVQRYQGRLFNTLLHVVGSREEAEDVSQEAFVQAFVKLDSFARRSAFYTWLYRIAFNISVSRRRRRRPEVSMDLHRERTGEEPRDASDGPGDQLLREEQVMQVREAIDSLNEEHRAILVLREMEGFCYDTIADILELPVGTVRSRLHRARLQLRTQLKEVLQENLAD